MKNIILPIKKKAGTDAKQNRQRTASQWLPVADIDNGFTYLKSGEVLATIRVTPVNIELLSKNESKRKISLLTEQLNGQKEELQIFAIGRPVDLDSYLMWLEEKSKESGDFKRKNLLKIFIRNAAAYAKGGQVTERRFYFVLRGKNAEKTSVDELSTRARRFVEQLASAEINAKLCGDDEVLELYSLFAFPGNVYDKVEKRWDIPMLYE